MHSCSFFAQLKYNFTHDPGIRVPDIYLVKLKAYVNTGTFVRMPMAIHSWKWEKLKLGKMSFNKSPAELHGILTTEYYSAIKSNELWNFKDMWNPSGHWQEEEVNLKGMYAVRSQWHHSGKTNLKDSKELRSRRVYTRKRSTGPFRP